jgi:hypothetical protein
MTDAASFFAEYPTRVADTAQALRTTILASIPKVEETVDRPDRVVGYGFGSGYAGLVCTIIPSRTGVKLGLVNGATLPDPAGLLEGAGKRHKYVLVSDPAAANTAAVKALLKSAHAAWKARTSR